MLKFLHLFEGLRGDFVITMTDADGENASKEIEILFSIDVVKVFPFSSVQDERIPVIVRNAGRDVFFMLLVYFFLSINALLLSRL